MLQESQIILGAYWCSSYIPQQGHYKNILQWYSYLSYQEYLKLKMKKGLVENNLDELVCERIYKHFTFNWGKYDNGF